MGCSYTGWGVSIQDVCSHTRWAVRIQDGVFVYRMRCSYTGWGVSIRDGVLVH